MEDKRDIAKIIEKFLLGSGDSWEWDDFISIPIEGDPELDAIRLWCAKLPDIYPPECVDKYCSKEGLQVLHRVMEYLRRQS